VERIYLHIALWDHIGYYLEFALLWDIHGMALRTEMRYVGFVYSLNVLLRGLK
jgi:hypothetical protein